MGVQTIDLTEKELSSRRSPIYLDNDSDDALHSTSPLKRKRGKALVDDEDETSPNKKGKCSPKKKKKDTGEKRLGQWRSQMPSSYKVLLQRATTQRMFVIDRTRTGTDEAPTEDVTLAGSTGNLYTINIAHRPTCNCPYALKGHECKHIVYVLHRVLKAPAELAYQRAFLTQELKDIFDKAPPLPGDKAKEGEVDEHGRKEIDGECPICCVEFDEGNKAGMTWCKSGCGNNMHTACFNQWAVQKCAMGGHVTCPFCRTPWQTQHDDKGSIDKSKATMRDGYVNVAGQLGMSGLRDTSTYHQVWVRKERNRGGLRDEDRGTGLL